MPVLEYLYFLPKNQRDKEILNLKSPTLTFFINFLYNVVKKVIPINKQLVNNLTPYKEKILQIVHKNKSLKYRKEILLKEGIFFNLLLLLLPLIRDLCKKENKCLSKSDSSGKESKERKKSSLDQGEEQLQTLGDKRDLVGENDKQQ